MVPLPPPRNHLSNSYLRSCLSCSVFLLSWACTMAVVLALPYVPSGTECQVWQPSFSLVCSLYSEELSSSLTEEGQLVRLGALKATWSTLTLF